MMGCPATTWFCKNGHIVAEYPHHYIPQNHDKEPCPICGARVWFVCEWGNPDYRQRVSVNPISSGDVSTYDVSNLFRERN